MKECVILIANHSGGELMEKVELLLGEERTNTILNRYDSQYMEEGQITIDFKLGFFDSTIHIGKCAYYIDVSVEWLTFISDTSMQLGIINELLALMSSSLGLSPFVAIVGEDRYNLVYEFVCEGYDLQRILNLDILNNEVNYIELFSDLRSDKFNYIKI